MSPKVKKGITLCIFFWLAAVLVANLHVPKVHKKPPENPVTVTRYEGSGPIERVRCIDDNEEALIRRLQLIESAREELILSTYYLGTDESGQDIMAALLHAADNGVKVRILADGFSGFLTLRNSEDFKALAESENVEAKLYNPIDLLRPWKINYRMHDKYLIADHHTYILGGRNTKNVSLGEYPGKHDTDRDMLVWTEDPTGSISQVRAYFEDIWSSKDAHAVKESRKTHRDGRENLEQRYEQLQTRYPEGFAPADMQALTIPVKKITLLTNPQQASNKVPELWASLIQLMKEGDSILAQTPYIICNEQMYADLEAVAQNSESFRILTNAPQSGANPNGCADFLNQRHRLRSTGAQIWEYAGERSAHSKTILIDGDISVVGSFNFDMRSAYLDTEMMLVIESPELNEQLRRVNQYYMDRSRSTDPQGETQFGACYEEPPEPLARKLMLSFLRFVTVPVRHLL